jgi:hypothetical protein
MIFPEYYRGFYIYTNIERLGRNYLVYRYENEIGTNNYLYNNYGGRNFCKAQIDAWHERAALLGVPL